MTQFFSEYYGKRITVDLDALSMDTNPPGTITWDPDYDRDEPENSLKGLAGFDCGREPYDEDADGEEADWYLGFILRVRVSREGIIETVFPEVRLWAWGSDGLGDPDPYECWSETADAQAKAWLDKITA